MIKSCIIGEGPDAVMVEVADSGAAGGRNFGQGVGANPVRVISLVDVREMPIALMKHDRDTRVNGFTDVGGEDSEFGLGSMVGTLETEIRPSLLRTCKDGGNILEGL